MAYQEDPNSVRVQGHWPNREKPYIDGDGTFTAMSPYYHITGVRIATAVDVQKSNAQECEEWRGHEKVYSLGDDPKKEMEIKEGNIILEIQVLPLRTVNLYFEDRRRAAERACLDVLQKVAGVGSAVIACVETSKTVQLWIILARKSKEVNTWRILGHLETGHIRNGIRHGGHIAPMSYRFLID
ncbi:MAG: hypothetical protein Q9167_003593 [Letrouitia subvulpina]